MLITPLSDGEGQAAKRRGGGASYNLGHSLPALARPLVACQSKKARGRGFYLLLNKCFFSSVVKLS